MKEPIILKTPFYYSWFQIPVVLFFSMIVLTFITFVTIHFLFYHQGPGLKKDEWLMILLVSILIFFSRLLIETAVKWFTDFFTVIVNGNEVTCFNLFKKKYKFTIDQINRVGKARGFFNKGLNHVSFMLRDNTNIVITPDVDCYGFLCDYIILRVTDDCEIEDEYISKLRVLPKFWGYTRRRPFTTEYDEGYFERLEKVVEKQRQELIAKGELKPNFFYGKF